MKQSKLGFWVGFTLFTTLLFGYGLVYFAMHLRDMAIDIRDLKVKVAELERQRVP
jgi:hypothetical protein